MVATVDDIEGVSARSQKFVSRAFPPCSGPHYEAGCSACPLTADSFDGVLAHLRACNMTMTCVSRGPLEKLLAYRERIGWSFNSASRQDSDFNLAFGYPPAGA